MKWIERNKEYEGYRMKKKRIFIGLTEIAGWGYSLQQGFRKQGYSADFFSLNKHPFQYAKDEKLFMCFMQQYRAYEFSFRWKSFTSNVLRYLENFMMIVFLLVALFRYDVFIFIFHQTFLRGQKDLPVLKFFHKKIIMIECGSDARPPYIDGGIIPQCSSVQEFVSWSRGRKRKIRWIERYADYIISHPPMALFHEKECLQFFRVGIAQAYEERVKKVAGMKSENKMVKIVHAPSNPLSKGTFKIREMISELKECGYSIEFIELQGKTNEVVMDILEDCDFVVDQIYSDSPMATFAMEAALLGKPAIVGGEYARYIRQETPEEIIPPAEYVQPDCVKKAIEKLITDVQYRKDLGQKAYEFVHGYWSLENVIQRFGRIIEDDVPKEWYFDPNHIVFPYGAAAPMDKISDCIRNIVTQYGVEALQVHDKPHIEKAYLDLIAKEE